MDNLYHHGIKGMRWGVRRYQNKDGTLTAAGKERYQNGKSYLEIGKQFIDQKKSEKVNGIQKNVGFGKTKCLAWAGITLSALATFLLLKQKRDEKKYEEERTRKFATRKLHELVSLYDKRTIKSIDDLPKLKSKEVLSESIKKVNPDFPKKGTVQNCAFCTAALAMREKGFDVMAHKTNEGWPTGTLFLNLFHSESVIMPSKQTAAQMLNTLSSFGPETYGNLSITWKSGAGHSVFWKNENGKIHIYDGQAGKEYDVSDPKNSKFINSIRLDDVVYNRFDNAQPTELVLAVLRESKG